jgi:hypothetical protein
VGTFNRCERPIVFIAPAVRPQPFPLRHRAAGASVTGLLDVVGVAPTSSASAQPAGKDLAENCFQHSDTVPPHCLRKSFSGMGELVIRAPRPAARLPLALRCRPGLGHRTPPRGKRADAATSEHQTHALHCLAAPRARRFSDDEARRNEPQSTCTYWTLTRSTMKLPATARTSTPCGPRPRTPASNVSVLPDALCVPIRTPST